MNPRNTAVAAALVLLTLLGFFQFPGHTFLQQDTQIYLPILEHFWDHNVFDRELIAKDPHVSFTIYDEMALLLRHATGFSFQAVLMAQQLILRALGLLGIYWIATSMRLRPRLALLVTAVFSLGATIGGPAVLTIEYEPVPRGFALPLLLLAVGLTAHGRYVWAGIAASFGLLYHAPAALPFLAVYTLLALWPAKPETKRHRVLGFVMLLAGVIVLFVLSRVQAGPGEPQQFFGRLSPALERIQRLRAPYNWISLWQPFWIHQYLFLWALSMAAFWRVRKYVTAELRFFALGLPLIGMLAIPTSYFLLERIKWVIVPQIQPARAVLFVVVFAEIMATVAAIKSAGERRYWESILWLVPVFAIPANTRVLQIVDPDLSDPLIRIRLLIVLALAALTCFAAWAVADQRRWALAPWAAAIVVPAFLLPGWGQMHNYKQPDNRDLQQLSSWARSHTPKDAMFLFPDEGRDLTSGMFRAQSLRAVYVDWKAGGQVNFLPGFAREWWSRWQNAGMDAFTSPDAGRYHALGIDYIVLAPAHRIRTRTPDFEDARFIVYRTAGPGT